MKGPDTRVITFGMSHFCEKARWALDWHGIAHEEIGWPPGLHVILAKRCGAKDTTLPILLDGGTVIQGSGAIIQGSGAIIDWAENNARNPGRSLTRPGALEIEVRADRVLGVHARRLGYAETLPRYPHMVKPAVFRKASTMHRLIGNAMWPVSRRAMMRMYHIGPTAASESRSALEAEFDWLDEQLADGRAYLAGDRFSRADLTVASLLAPFARPEAMPIYRDLPAPDALAADAERWRGRPVMRWVAAQYERHRVPQAKEAAVAS